MRGSDARRARGNPPREREPAAREGIGRGSGPAGKADPAPSPLAGEGGGEGVRRPPGKEPRWRTSPARRARSGCAGVPLTLGGVGAPPTTHWLSRQGRGNRKGSDTRRGRDPAPSPLAGEGGGEGVRRLPDRPRSPTRPHFGPDRARSLPRLPRNQRLLGRIEAARSERERRGLPGAGCGPGRARAVNRLTVQRVTLHVPGFAVRGASRPAGQAGASGRTGFQRTGRRDGVCGVQLERRRKPPTYGPPRNRKPRTRRAIGQQQRLRNNATSTSYERGNI